MSKQSFTTGQVLTAAQVNSLQSNDFNQTVSVKTDNYTLVAADKGTRIEFNTSGSVTCTVNTGLFDAGDTLVIQNRGAGTATITAGTATVNTSASLALAQYSAGTLYFVSASAALFFGDAAGISASIVDAKGDLIVGTADNTVARLAVGTNGHTIVADSSTSTGLKWAAPAAAGFKGCRLTFSSGVTVANATNVTVNWDVETFDTDAFHSTVSNTSRITIPAGLDGKYLVVAKALLENAAEGLSILRLYKNGTQVFTIDMYKWNGGYTHTTLTDILSLVATDYLEIVWYQNTGSSGTLQAGQTTSFGVQFLGA